MKNNFCLYERPFKIQKNGVFVFEISFFHFRDTDVFLLYKFISDDVILFATKNVKILNKQYLKKY